MRAGDKYFDRIENVKMKNGKPTIIKINDVCYRFDPAATEKEKKAKLLTIEQRRDRLRKMGRID